MLLNDILNTPFFGKLLIYMFHRIQMPKNVNFVTVIMGIPHSEPHANVLSNIITQAMYTSLCVVNLSIVLAACELAFRALHFAACAVALPGIVLCCFHSVISVQPKIVS